MQTIRYAASNTDWRLQDAKAQFSALVDQALRGVPQHVTRRGKRAVVVLSEEDFEALQRGAGQAGDQPRSLSAHLLAIPKHPGEPDDALAGLDLQPRELDFS